MKHGVSCQLWVHPLPHSALELLRTLFLDTLSPGTLRGGSVSGLSRLNVSKEFVEKEALGFGYPPRPMR